MHIKELTLKGVKLITPQVFYDERGFFLETFHQTRYLEIGMFVQDNLSCSKYGTIRGMHFQTRPGQAKLVQVIKGKIFDVFVDIRKDSPTFGRWEGVYLEEGTHQQLFIPVGFAHGFCAMSAETLVLYKVSSEYHSDTEKGFRYDDPAVGIKWPISNPIVSERDLRAPLLKDLEG
ncbi:MAG: dTDP-4-dehydrorhamnose 3,5-epimerase [Chlamydiota bacterium]